MNVLVIEPISKIAAVFPRAPDARLAARAHADGEPGMARGTALEDGFDALLKAHASEASRPSRGSAHGLLPARVLALALVLVHLRLPALVLGPALAELVLVGPEAGRQAGGVGGAERGRLGHLRADHGHAEHVGLELHQQLVGGHAAVDAQLGERDVGDALAASTTSRDCQAAASSAARAMWPRLA